MAILKIRKAGDEVLAKVSRPVEEITPRILTLLDDMVETMHRADGVGLAAPQVGVLRRVVVIETEESGLLELINPVIVATKGEQRDAEGCLSVPGVYGVTVRPMRVTVKALDRHGREIEVTGEDLLARALCHEIDHLDGHLFTEHVVEYLGDNN